MIEFSYTRAKDTSGAIRLSSAAVRPKYLGGGTNLVDLMRETVERPDALVDVTGLSSDIEARGDGSLLIGAAAKNTAVAADRKVRTHFPMLSRALLSGASGQIRNNATVGGHKLQRTSCRM
jgi:xanthine dehydrogenase YagS FAD-binding subunit